MARHKFSAKRAELDGINFDSRKERNYYLRLKADQQNGRVCFFLRQVPFDLPGGVKYRCDFAVFWADGHVSFVDVKGYPTPQYKAKKKMVEALYPVEIEEK